MKVAVHFNGIVFAIGAFLMALGAALGTQIAELASSPWKERLGWSGFAVLVVGIITSIAGVIRFSLAIGKIHASWGTKQVLQEIAKAGPSATVSLLQTSFPDAATVFPKIKSLLKKGGTFKLRILMPHPTSAMGLAVINARVKLRDEGSDFHRREIESQIRQLIQLKTDIDLAWEKTRDHAKLDLQIRLYEHFPFGPQVHVGDKKSFVGFFLSSKSSVHAPMIELSPGDDPVWSVFREDFEIAWAAAEPYSA